MFVNNILYLILPVLLNSYIKLYIDYQEIETLVSGARKICSMLFIIKLLINKNGGKYISLQQQDSETYNRVKHSINIQILFPFEVNYFSNLSLLFINLTNKFLDWKVVGYPSVW